LSSYPPGEDVASKLSTALTLSLRDKWSPDHGQSKSSISGRQPAGKVTRASPRAAVLQLLAGSSIGQLVLDCFATSVLFHKRHVLPHRCGRARGVGVCTREAICMRFNFIF
jgi:hypothetical protein